MKLLITNMLIILTSISLEAKVDQQIKAIDGTNINFADYKNKVVLVVNIATKCGYTKQLDGLEKIYDKYKHKGFTVVGVPSNDFGGQTPEGDGEVKKFCKLNYGVSFPLSKKVTVLGDDKHPLIKQLISGSGDSVEISWNFEKFLINKSGEVVGRYKSAIEPESKQLTSIIESFL